MELKRTIAGVGAAAAVFAGSVLVAVPAIAQDETTDTGTDDTTVEAPHRHRGDTKFTAIADVLGIDTDELRQRLADSESVADIAAAQGVSVDDVIAALMGDAEARLDAAVTDERLTQDEADERLVEIEERVTDLVNGEIEFGSHGFGAHGFGGPRGFGFGSGEVADLLGLDATELMERLQDGATLAEIASEQGVSLDDLKSAIVQPASDRLDEAVADGDLTQAEADEKLAEIDARTDDLINGELLLGGPGFGRGRGFGSHHGEGLGAGSPNAVEGATTDA